MSPAPRIPFASSLADCVHRLARLQLTREQRPRPRPAGVSGQDRALDRLIVAARRVARLSVVLVALAVALSGCGRAIPGKTFLIPTWATALTPEERAEADRIELAIDRICTRIVQNGFKCTKPRLFVVSREALAQYDPAWNAVTLPRWLLTAKARDAAEAVVAHELSHWAFPDARIATPEQDRERVARERNANLHAAELLVWVFDYTPKQAAAAVWRALAAGVRGNAKPSNGHPDACAELHDFERRVGTTRPHDWS